MRPILCMLIILVLPLAHAETFILSPGKVTIDVPKDWESAKGLLGIQLMLAGPYHGERRSIVTVESTVLEETFNAQSLTKDQGSFRLGRFRWLEKYSGKALSFFPYKVEKLKQGLEDHSIGYEYEINGQRYWEMSHYIPCGKILFHLKALVPAEEKTAELPKINWMIHSFTCGDGRGQ